MKEHFRGRRRVAENGILACSDPTNLVKRAWEGTASLLAESICIPELPPTPKVSVCIR